MGGFYRTIKAVETVTSGLKRKPKKSQDFQPQNEGRTEVNFRFPLKTKRDCLTTLLDNPYSLEAGDALLSQLITLLGNL